MYDRSFLLELFLEIEEAIRRIERRFATINSPDDFLQDDTGLDRLDAIAMMLIAIGENLQRLDRIVDPDTFAQFSDIDWVSAKGIRNILAHNYFSIDAEEIYHICSQEIPKLKGAINTIRSKIL